MRRSILGRSTVLAAAVMMIGALPRDQSGARVSRVRASVDGGALSLANGIVSVRWRIALRHLEFVSSADADGRRQLPAVDEPFVLTVGGKEIPASKMMVQGAPRVSALPVSGRAPRLAERSPGMEIDLTLSSPEIAGPVTWRAILREGASYWRQQVVVGPVTTDVVISNLALVVAHARDATVAGTVPGSPVVVGDAFLGVEHPMSACRLDDDRISCALARAVPLRAGQTLDVSSVTGLAAPGQLRRAVRAYLERERVHPYRPFLHYNSWYDLGYFTPYTEQDALDVIDAFGRELVEKRHVTMTSFLFDDGWDNHQSLWSFNEGFPNGFRRLTAEARKFGAAPGVWMSPFGGYGNPRTERLTFGKAQGFETNERGFALSGPVYYKRFRDVCVDMVTSFGVNQFKFDGLGRATGVVPGSQFGSDFEAAIHLIRDELRAIKPDLFINLTTGTWPSPFWLLYADSIWRGGEDHSFAGVGTKRQQWITYRDAQTYRNVVQGGPLFPISSLMLHGLIYARHAQDLEADPGDDFTAEVRAYFGTGTQLQELYVTPALMSDKNWDAIAQSAGWARRNADVLSDVHWIGGDPAALAIYGHAAWTPRLGIVVLRNPGDKPATFALDVEQAFELPADAARVYQARSPWPEDQAKRALTLKAGTPATISLGPFEVLTLEATPRGR